MMKRHSMMNTELVLGQEQAVLYTETVPLHVTDQRHELRVRIVVPALKKRDLVGKALREASERVIVEHVSLELRNHAVDDVTRLAGTWAIPVEQIVEGLKKAEPDANRSTPSPMEER